MYMCTYFCKYKNRNSRDYYQPHSSVGADARSHPRWLRQIYLSEHFEKFSNRDCVRVCFIAVCCSVL